MYVFVCMCVCASECFCMYVYVRTCIFSEGVNKSVSVLVCVWCIGVCVCE